jgi:outer membrane murein-binding lipoprotein Lpp
MSSLQTHYTSAMAQLQSRIDQLVDDVNTKDEQVRSASLSVL